VEAPQLGTPVTTAHASEFHDSTSESLLNQFLFPISPSYGSVGESENGNPVEPRPNATLLRSRGPTPQLRTRLQTGARSESFDAFAEFHLVSFRMSSRGIQRRAPW